MSWYDKFSNVYGVLIEPHYEKARKTGIENLNLKEGDTVLDLACGTGPNFKYLSPLVGETGLVIGLDYSKGMLKKATKKITKNKCENIVLVQEDAREISVEQLNKACKREVKLDKIICVLGLSVIPEYESVLESTFSLLKPKGNYAIIDIYADKFVLQSWYVQLAARANLKRKSWKFLEKNCSIFSMKTFLKTVTYMEGFYTLLWVKNNKI